MSLIFGNNPYGTLGPSPARAARINTTMRPKPKPKAKPKPRSLTPEQWAEQQVAELIAAQVAGVEEQRKIYLDELDKRARLEQQRGLALAAALREMNFPGRIQQVFGAAAGDVSGLAGGFSEQMRGIAAADAAQQAHMLSGTGQEGAVRNEGVGMADVNFGAQGFIPGRSLSDSGAGFAAQAALEPGFAAQIGAMEAARVNREGMEGMSDFTKALIEIRSQRPELIREMLDRRQSMLMDQQKMKLDERDAEREWYLKLAALEMQRGNNARANQYLALAQQREVRQVGSEQRRAMKDKGLDAAGNLLPGYEMKGGRVVKSKAPSRGSKPSTSSTVPGTPAYNARAVQNVGVAQKNIEADIKAMATKPTAAEIRAGADPFSVKTPAYRDAYNRLWNKYKYLGTTAAAKAALKNAIVRALAAAGIQKPSASRLNTYPR